jgi:pyridoxamine 5'-phosphate oxidase
MNWKEETNPYTIFEAWFKEAKEAIGEEDASAVCVATADSTGQPSARMLLLKAFDARGFVFFTNETSRKGKELEENPKAALCLYWHSLDRQVRIEGKIEHATEKEADDYFASRRRGSQIGAWASAQSSTIATMDALKEDVAKYEAEFEGKDVPRPPFWHGYRVIPHAIEFWEEGEFRLHTRKKFTLDNASWNIHQLSP